MWILEPGVAKWATRLWIVQILKTSVKISILKGRLLMEIKGDMVVNNGVPHKIIGSIILSIFPISIGNNIYDVVHIPNISHDVFVK